MKVRLLGTAAGGGLPQWNCACPHCTRARRDPAAHARTQDCLAVSANGADWYLLNSSPDIRTQILAAPELVPGPGPRDTPLRGVLLTDAELDHVLGLLALREGAALDVHATAPVLSALDDGFPAGPVLAPYGAVTWHRVTCGPAFTLAGGLRVTAVPLGTKRPRYAAGRPTAAEWVAAYRVHDPATGGTLLYAPCLATWSADFAAALDDVACLLLDGSFFYDDEMARTAGRPTTARAMGHLPIQHSLPELVRRPGLRCLYTHLNNTNPVLDPASPEHAAVRAAGAAIAADGHVLDL